MAGYAASTRIASVAPRARSERSVASRSIAADPVGAVVTIDLIGGPTRPRSERMEALRERWAQATFFLFDANSWR